MINLLARGAFAPLALALAMASPLCLAAPNTDTVASSERFEHARVHFASGSSELSRSSRAALSQIVSRALASGKSIAAIRLEGHTDAAGENFYNDYLGSDRTMSAGSFIEEMLFVGLPVAAYSFGPRAPAALCGDAPSSSRKPACMAASRRVDAYIVYR